MSIDKNEGNANEITISEGENFENVIQAVRLTDYEVAYDIWLIGLEKQGPPYLKGMSREGILKKLNEMGYYKRCSTNNSLFFIREQSNIIDLVESHNMKEEFTSYVTQLNDLEFEFDRHRIQISKEKFKETFFRQSHLLFNDTFLTHLPNHDKLILRDTKSTAYFFFQNCIIAITNSNLIKMEYTDICDSCIWKSHILPQSFEYLNENQNCHFARFINNVSNNDQDRINAIISAIGYLLHNFSHQSQGQAIIAYDEEITDLKNPMGGTGKGLLANAIRQLRTIVRIDGKKFDEHDRFKFQDISENTQVVWLDDIKPELGFATFNSCLTDGWSIENKFQKQYFIKHEASPKVYLCSNSILKGGGTTITRRQFIIEFSNHYSKHIKHGNEEPIRDEHGCTFFDNDDWNTIEWHLFFSYMLDCCQFYLLHGLVGYEYKSLLKNSLIQATSLDFIEWLALQKLELGKDYNSKELFEEFKSTYYGDDASFKQRSFTNWMKKNADVNKWTFSIRKSNGISYFSLNEK